jgi:5-methylcytosine-specific restriction endonuclease McrA
MMTRALIICTLLMVAPSWAQSSSAPPFSRTNSHTTATKYTAVYHYPHTKTPSYRRTGAIEIKHSPQAKSEFMKTHPCPSTGRTNGSCKGYVVDHVVPLESGGVDAPSNMQWQANAATKAKDKS